ncbi:MAG TPA: hypothetical protein VKV26_04535 [Dehalococcoidia bacterium]|nr:hypothetical protein [Dehalococcoidia bacterium]
MLRGLHLSRFRLGILAVATLSVLGGSWALSQQHVAAQAAPTVQTRTTGLGTVLTGTDGKTLYVFDRDTSSESNCNGACSTTWPPLVLASGNPTAPAGVGGAFTVITRQDGSHQVSYNGHPLYFYAPDAQPGDTKGDGVGGVWHAAKPIAGAAAPAAPAAGAAAAPRAMPATGSGGQAGDTGRNAGLIVAVVLGAVLLSGAGIAFARRSSTTS